MDTDYEKLAAVEMEHHREQLLYAEKQHLKAGDFSTVASSLRKRSRTRLIIASLAAVWLVNSYVQTGSVISLVVAGLVIVEYVVEYSHAKRTQETIERLEAAEQLENQEAA